MFKYLEIDNIHCNSIFVVYFNYHCWCQKNKSWYLLNLAKIHDVSIQSKLTDTLYFIYFSSL